MPSHLATGDAHDAIGISRLTFIIPPVDHSPGAGKLVREPNDQILKLGMFRPTSIASSTDEQHSLAVRILEMNVHGRQVQFSDLSPQLNDSSSNLCRLPVER